MAANAVITNHESQMAPRLRRSRHLPRGRAHLYRRHPGLSEETSVIEQKSGLEEGPGLGEA